MAFGAALLLIVVWLLLKSAVVTALTMLVLGGLHHISPGVPAPGFVALFPIMVGFVVLITLLFARVEIKRD